MQHDPVNRERDAFFSEDRARWLELFTLGLEGITIGELVNALDFFAQSFKAGTCLRIRPFNGMKLREKRGNEFG